MLPFALDEPLYCFEFDRQPRPQTIEWQIGQLLEAIGVEYYYEAVYYPHSWDEFGNVTESSNPDFHVSSTPTRSAIEIETTLVGSPALPVLGGGNYHEAKAQGALRRKRRQAGLRLKQYGINTLIIDYPVYDWLRLHPGAIHHLIEVTARSHKIMSHHPHYQPRLHAVA